MNTTPAYERAASARSRLLARHQEVVERLESSARGGVLRSFSAVLSRGRAGINMPIPKLLHFVEEGSYLNIYEFIARETGLAGKELDPAVEERLRELGPLRLKLDRLFHFQHDTHYASFNLGGAGARRYGCCCVIFDLRHWAPFHTCFAGDSIRACCSVDGRQVLEDDTILESFAIGEDAERLAVIRHESFLLKQESCVDPSEVRDILESDDSLIEIHLHGPVTRDCIQEVRLARPEYRRLRELSDRARRFPEPLPWEFDSVEPFRRMLEALDRFQIPLVLAEGG